VFYILYIWYILCICVCFLKATVRACCLSLVSLLFRVHVFSFALAYMYTIYVSEQIK